MTPRVTGETRTNRSQGKGQKNFQTGADFSLLSYNILYSLLLMMVLITIRPGYFLFLGIIMIGSLISWTIIYFWRKTFPKKIYFAVIKVLLFSTVIYYLAVYTGGYGFLGIIIFVLLVVAYKLFTQRNEYLEALRLIESRLWGKPLDRKHWDPGELKKTKIKFVWRKKK